MSELERALVTLGRELEIPEAPDIVPAVLQRLASGERRRAATSGRWVLAVAVAALAVLAATLAVPEARSALFRVLHIGGERIERVDELPQVAPDPAELDLDQALGERVSLAEARRRAGFDLRELEDAPDRVYLGDRGTVWFLYGEPSKVRLLVAQTPRVGVDEILIKKLVGSETAVEAVDVGSARGYYIGGAPHAVLLLDEQGHPVEESIRLAQNVLVWEQDGVAFRLEGDFRKNQALELAGSLR